MATAPIGAHVMAATADITSTAPSVPGLVDPEPSKGERTRARIVSVAIAQFGTTGYRHTSLAAVARAADLTPAAVYPYFPTKHELFLAAADAAIDTLLIEAAAAVAGSAMPWFSLFPYVLRAVPAHPLVARILADEAPEIVRELLESPALLRLRGELVAHAAEMQRRQIFRSDVPATMMATAMETLFLGQLLFRVRSGLVETDERMAAVGVLLAKALLPEPPVAGH